MKFTSFLLSCFAAFTLLLGTVQAQSSPCTPDTSLTVQGIYPSPLPDGCVGQLYNEVAQFVFPVDTFIFGFTILFDSFQINTVNNIPAGISYACNLSSCKFYSTPGQPARGCATISGIPTTAIGPNNLMGISFTGWGTIPGIGVQLFVFVIDLQLDIYASPTAAFSSSSAVNVVTFANASTGATSYSWDFGDGNTSTATNPVHNYPGSGNYQVCLIADNGNCTDTTCMVVATGCPAPSAAWSQMANNLSVTFTDMSLSANPSWIWDFGDGNTSMAQNPNHTYATPGTYLVCLSIVDSCGSDSSCTQVTVVCPAPSAAFSSTDSLLVVSFMDGSSGSGTLNYVWDFGDGNTSTMQNPVHTYAMYGTYQVCLSITDDCGTDSSCTQVTLVCPAPSVAFSSTTSLLVASFMDGSSGSGTLNYVWNFGDGNTSTIQNPVHTYAMDGIYQVCLSIVDDCGSDSTCQMLSVIGAGLAEPGALTSLTVYPNPNTGTFVLKGNRNLTEEMIIRVTDVVGKTLYLQGLEAGLGEFSTQISLSQAVAGMYFVQVQAGNAVRTIKVQIR